MESGLVGLEGEGYVVVRILVTLTETPSSVLSRMLERAFNLRGRV